MSAFLFRRKDKPKPFNEELFKKVRKILSEKLAIIEEAKVTPDSRIMDDLGADSLNVVELVMDFEEAFSIEIPDEDVDKINTVKEIVEYIEAKLKKRNTEFSY